MVDLLIHSQACEDDDSSSMSSSLSMDEPNNNNNFKPFKSSLGTICEDNEAYDSSMTGPNPFSLIDARSEGGSPEVVSRLLPLQWVTPCEVIEELLWFDVQFYSYIVVCATITHTSSFTLALLNSDPNKGHWLLLFENALSPGTNSLKKLFAKCYQLHSTVFKRVYIGYEILRFEKVVLDFSRFLISC